MSTTTVTKEQQATTVGYTVKAVIDRIVALDIDAGGNTEKAAWKRYLGLCLLSLAKGWDVKRVVELVFGKGEKPSKNFQNMMSLAKLVRHNPDLLGNHKWADVGVMSIDDAQNAVFDMINRHMAVLAVSSKNEYAKWGGSSLAEIELRKKAEAEAAAAAEAEKAEAAAAAEAEAAEAEADAKDKADATPERTAAQAAIAALHEASKDDLMSVFAHIATRIDLAALKQAHGDIAAIIANLEAAADAKIEAAIKGKKAA